MNTDKKNQTATKKALPRHRAILSTEDAAAAPADAGNHLMHHEQKRRGRIGRALSVFFFALFALSSSHASTVTNKVINARGLPVSTNICFTPQSTPLAESGSLILSQQQVVT